MWMAGDGPVDDVPVVWLCIGDGTVPAALVREPIRRWECRSWGCFGCARDFAFSFSFDTASCAFFEAKRRRFKENLMSKCLSLTSHRN